MECQLIPCGSRSTPRSSLLLLSSPHRIILYVLISNSPSPYSPPLSISFPHRITASTKDYDGWLGQRKVNKHNASITITITITIDNHNHSFLFYCYSFSPSSSFFIISYSSLHFPNSLPSSQLIHSLLPILIHTYIHSNSFLFYFLLFSVFSSLFYSLLPHIKHKPKKNANSEKSTIRTITKKWGRIRGDTIMYRLKTASSLMHNESIPFETAPTLVTGRLSVSEQGEV